VNLYLPRTAAEVRPASQTAESQAASPRKGAVVLLVDDDDAVRQVTAGMLADLGYGIVEAGSGGAALEALERSAAVDLVLLDFAMPGMNGADVAREIRARRPDLPIVFATGYADTEVLVAANEDCIVRKPFVERELAEKLQARLA
jgi:CheY-like chemotaxis protein